MSSTILSGNWTVFYLSENRQKRVVWAGSATGTNTVNQLYSALSDLMDDVTQMAEGDVMSAQTPTQYTIGTIDSSDTNKDPWFIDRTSVEHLTGGAITTSGWTRTTGTATGIVRVPYTIGTQFVTSDIGKTVTNGTSASTGTLLDFNSTGSIMYMWIRPASNASGNDWSGSSGTVTVTSGTGSVTQSGPAVTGDSLWANVYSLGTIVTPGTHLYLYQNGSRVVSYKTSSIDWWSDGQIDVLLPTKELNIFIDGLRAPVNSAFSTATTGGSLSNGTYYYRVTAYNAQGETLPSTETSIAIAGGTSTQTVTVNWGTVTGATGYRVYGRSTGAELFMQQILAGTTTWIDTGSVTPAGAMPTADTSGGYATVFARQYTTTYSDYSLSVASGGRNPLPLATGADINNTTGYREFTGSSGVGTFVIGEIIFTPSSGAESAATAAGIVTKVAGTTAAPILDYYIIEAPSTGLLTDFVNTNTIKGNTSGATCTAGAPSNVGPATSPSSTLTITFGANSTFDIDQSGTNENYSIVINLQSTVSVAQAYEETKYLTRFGATSTLNGITGESYIGEDYRINYSTITGTINVGDVVFQTNSGAVGTVVANNISPAGGASKYLILRNHVGTFNNTDNILKDSSNFVTSPTSTAITPIHAAPFGTFAGGTWFCAPGVVLQNFLTSDTNKFSLVSDQGVTIKEPTSVTTTVSNCRTGDAVVVFLTSGGLINKSQYTATSQSIGATTVVVSTAITQDTAGRSAGGALRLVQGNAEYRTRFSSWSASTFTLASYTGLTATAGTSSTTIIATGATFQTQGILVGDVVRNLTHAAVGYVTSVVSQTQINVTTMAGTVSGDSFELNTLPVATAGTETWYVPIIDVIETTGTDASPSSTATSTVYLSNNPVLVRVRHNLSGDQYNIVPFETTGTISSAGLSVSTIRTKDTIST